MKILKQAEQWPFRVAVYDKGLEDLIADYSQNGYSCEPGESYGDCASNSQDFLHMLHQQKDLAPELYHFYSPLTSVFPSPIRKDLTGNAEGYWDDNEGHQIEHFVPVVTHNGQKHVVDWTMRQFDPEAEVPHVEPLDTYQKRFLFGEPYDEDLL